MYISIYLGNRYIYVYRGTINIIREPSKCKKIVAFGNWQNLRKLIIQKVGSQLIHRNKGLLEKYFCYRRISTHFG